ncbi:putative signal transduction protein with EAL and GGDEF domain [Agromyces hippuratus]|uniref:Putative signal transduction protein with EAL and GGDEF domain n=2 Tax=Agromyces hippuratus TaxID=286438 RepID=A0A852WT31_9MICO|nr:hypothetical protein [Agromyces hippuratus]NYG20708.1 putative signal transduction protein with EAL and GGDEF domain [Agromyces hippuratus]
MGREPAFRIVRWELKVLYIVVAWIVGYALADLLRRLDAAEIVIGIVSLILDIVAFVIAVRIFRGRGEPIDPPRAWWRMTGWRPLSRRLGVVFGALAAFSLVCVVGESVGAVAANGAAFGWLGLTVQSGVLCLLYLNSAAQMTRLGIVKPERLRPTIRLT